MMCTDPRKTPNNPPLAMPRSQPVTGTCPSFFLFYSRSLAIAIHFSQPGRSVVSSWSLTAVAIELRRRVLTCHFALVIDIDRRNNLPNANVRCASPPV